MSRLAIDPLLRAGVAHHGQGRFAEAAGMYQQILALQPNHAEALHLLGVLESQHGRYERACEMIGRAIALSPANASYHRNLGTAQRHLGLLDQTILSWRRSISLKPNSPDLVNSLGTALQEKGLLSEAIVCFRRSISMAPANAEAHYNLGLALAETGDLDEAVACYLRSLELKPDYVDAYNNLGKVYKDRGQLDESISSYRRALELDPNHLVAHQNLLLAMQYHPASTPQSLLAEARRWNDRFAKPLARFDRPHLNNRTSERRLRIGYMSPDFRNHPVGRFVLPLISRHDRAGFEVFCYSQLKVPDAMTEKLRAQADHWREITALSDEQAAEMIRVDRIDILIDLALHTAGNRLPVLARKPAPVQITFAGYAGTTGMDAIDIRLTDPWLDPPGEGDENYSEKSVRLPETFLCDDAMPTEPGVTELPALTNGFITFGCLNNFCKVNTDLLKMWGELLCAVDSSRLILFAPQGKARQSVIDRLGQQRVDSDRIEFVGMQPVGDYLRTYNRIDIALDTWPYNGYTTSFDALWMGVPLVSLAGHTAVGRAGASQLGNLNLQELIGQTPGQYIQIANGLANDLPRLCSLRQTMRARMKGSALMDAERYVRGIETIYREQWRKWCEGNDR